MPAPLRTPTPARDTAARVRAAALAVLLAVTGLMLAGFATFGLHPERLAEVPAAAPIYALAYRWLPGTHIWLSLGVLALALTTVARLRWVPAFLALYALSLTSELLGTTFGIPFGEYRYSPLLGAAWMERVPVVIPLSWFAMAVPAYGLARAALGTRRSRWLAVALGSVLLTAWDLCLDPAMSFVTRYWIWGDVGPYYGMPWLNLVGWYVTGVALMSTLALLRADEWIARLPARWLAGYYGANLLLPLGMTAAAALWPAVIATLGALLAAWLLARRLAPVALAAPVEREAVPALARRA